MFTLQALRKAKGWGRERLARKAGLNPVSVWNLESGNVRSPRLVTILRLALALGVHPSFLMREVEDLTPDERKELGL